MIEAISEYAFFRNAVIASLFAGIICGIVGVIIVEKKLVMMSGGIAHTAYGGVGLGYLLGFEPLIGAGLFSVGAAFGIGYLRKKGGAQTDVIISLFWALGMAFGIAFVSFMPGYPPDLNSYLFGNILTVEKADLILMIPLALIILAFVIIFANDIRAYMFDEGFSYIIGLNTKFIEYTLLVIISLSVVILLRVTGIILVIALLTAPAACAAMISGNLKNRMILSSLFCIAFCLVGLFISYELGIPSGATIIFVSVLTYAVMFCVRRLLDTMVKKK